jgi:hypothetical protein
MGKVYSVEAVAAGNIPEPGAHVEAGQFILDELFGGPNENFFSDDFRITDDFLDPNSLVSGMVYGSTAQGKANIRSDVDVLINYSERDPATAFSAIRGVFAAARERYKVPIESHILPDAVLLRKAQHGVDSLFASHLLEVAASPDDPSWTRNNPVQYLKAGGLEEPDPYRDRLIAEAYVSEKRNNFTKVLGNLDRGMDVDALQRALELPSAIGRKVLVASHEDGDIIPHISEKAATREAVLRKTEELAPEGFECAADSQRQLIAFEQEYSEMLDSVLDGATTLEAYDAWLQHAYEPAVLAAHSVSSAWAAYFRRANECSASEGELIAVIGAHRSGY